MRPRHLIGIGFPLLLLPLLLAADQLPVSGRSTALTISVAASMQDALKAIQPIYHYQTPEVELTFNFGSSGSLQRQIEQGAPVDLFISAASRQVDVLEEQGLINPETRVDLVINQLVMITPEENPAIDTPQDLALPSIQQIALGEPSSVPAGTYGKQALESLKLFPTLTSKLVFSKDVRQVLTYVETGNVDAGVVYQTDALRSDGVKVAHVFPPELHDPIVYPVAVIQTSSHPELAQNFVEFLQSESAQEIFVQHGFSQPYQSE